MLITRLLLVLEVWDGKPTYRKSWAGNVFVVGFDLGPLLQGGTRILHLQYFFKYVLTYFLHLNSYLVTFLHNTICRAQLFCPFLSASEFLMFNYHLLYFCTALSLIIMLSSHHLHKSKTLSQLTQCPFTGTLLLFKNVFPIFCSQWLRLLQWLRLPQAAVVFFSATFMCQIFLLSVSCNKNLIV